MTIPFTESKLFLSPLYLAKEYSIGVLSTR